MELRNRDSSHRHGVHANAKKEMSNRTGSIKRRYANDRALNNTTADAALDKRPFFRKSLWGAKNRFVSRRSQDLQAEREFWHPARTWRRAPSPARCAMSGKLVSASGKLDRLRGRLRGPLLGRLLRLLLRNRILDRLDQVGLLWLSDVHAPQCFSATSSPNSIASSSCDQSLASVTVTGTP